MNLRILELVIGAVLISLGLAVLLAFTTGNAVAKWRTPARIAAALGAAIFGTVLTVAIAVGLWRVTIRDPGIGGALFCMAAGLITAPAYGILVFFGLTKRGVWWSIASVVAGVLVLLFFSWPLEQSRADLHSQTHRQVRERSKRSESHTPVGYIGWHE